MKPYDKPVGHNWIVAKVCAALVAALGILVIIGWRISNQSLIQILPYLAPMQFNTALAFFVSGVGLLAFSLGWRRISSIAGFCVCAIGIATLFQYISGVSLGIDQALMKEHISVQTSHPGRMAPNTALCFALTGAILLSGAFPNFASLRFTLKRSLILLSSVLSVVALLGYLTQVETAYGWINLTRMALHTSIGFIILNIGMLATTIRNKNIFEELRSSTGWLAFAGVAITMISAVSLSFEFEKNETKNIRSELARETLFVKTALKNALDERFQGVEWVLRRWDFRGDAQVSGPKDGARDLLSPYHELLAVGYANAQFTLNRIDRVNGDISASQIEILLNSKLVQLRDRASSKPEAASPAPVGAPIDGGYYFRLFPIVDDGMPIGYSVGVFDLDALATTELSKVHISKHDVSLYRGDTPVFQSGAPTARIAARWGVSETLEIDGVFWKLTVWPKAALLNEKRSPLRFIAIGVGLLFSLLFLSMYRYGVAARRRAIERAHAAAFLETVLNNVSDAIVACDENGDLSVFNEGAKKLYGVDNAANVATDWSAVFGSACGGGNASVAKKCSPVCRAFNDQQVREQEIIITPDDAAPRIVIANATPLLDTHGEKIGAVATMRDISAERAALEEARRSAEELKLIFDNVPVRLWLKDENSRIRRLNQRAAEFMGASASEAEGKEIRELYPEVANKHADNEPSVLERGEPVLGVIEEFVSSSGDRSWASVDKAPYVDEKTGEKFIFVASTDITKLVQAREELQRSNAELEQFARVASHDLQEPLRKLMIYSGFLAHDLGGDISTKAKADLVAIEASADRMRNLVKDMLSLSRIRSGGFKTQRVDPHECIVSAMASLSARCHDTGAVIVYGDLPDVMAEPVMLTQVYQNLACNALKFAKPDRAPRIKFASEETVNGVVLSVEDNGIGVDPAFYEKIFEPLMRVHSAESYDGTGIGLAICKKAIESYGGRIWIEAAPDGGAIFKFLLKRADAMESAA